MLGYSYSLTNKEKNLGMDLTAQGDVGMNYELPMYTMNQFFVSRQRFSAFIGGRQTISFLLYVFRLNFYIDVWPARLTYENYYSNDYLVTGDNCLAGFFYFDSFRVQLYTQLDYCDMAWGVVGIILNDIGSCTWQNYYLNKPLLDWPIIFDGSESELYRSSGCGTRTIERYDTA